MRYPLIRLQSSAVVASLACALAGCVGAAPELDPTVADPALTAPEAPATTPTSEPMSCATAGHTYRCKGRIRTDMRALPNATATGYGPADLASAYALNTSLKPTTTIAVVDAFGYPNAESDLAQYRSHYGLPACTVASGCLTIVNQQGQKSPLPSPPPANDDWTVETALDLDMASAACPSCKLLLVQANDDTSNGLLVAQAAAANLGAAVISDSWGGPESAQQTGQSQESFFNLGKPVTIFVAAGDSGYDDGGQGPDYPSVSAYVIAVGGTSLKKSTTTTRGWVETAWSTSANGGAGGSSCSISVPKPSYQASLTTACTFRAASDVAAVGDPATGLTVYNAGAGGFIVVGGTSASAPFVAGVFALNGLGAAGPTYPYAHATAWNDVTSGTNGTCGNVLCNAGKGWDGPTGLGTPIGSVLGGVATTPDMASAPADMASAPVATGGGTGTGTGAGTGSGNGEGGGANNATGGSGSGTGGNGAGAQGGFVGGCSTAGAASSGAGALFMLALGLAALATRRRRRD